MLAVTDDYLHLHAMPVQQHVKSTENCVTLTSSRICAMPSMQRVRTKDDTMTVKHT